MKVMIIDCQEKRRSLIEKWLGQEGHEAIAYSHVGDHSEDSQMPDILLLHIGVNQEAPYSQENRTERVAEILERFCTKVWTMGYSGGAIAEAAMRIDYPKYARYRPQVPGDDFPIGMRNVTSKILVESDNSRQMDQQTFKAIVTGFDQIREYQLQSLATVLKNGTIEDDLLQELINSLPDTVDLEEDRLPLPPRDRASFAKRLRDKCFGQWS